MKLIPIILCCSIIVSDFKLTSGQDFLKGLLEKLHKTEEKVKADIHMLSEKVKADMQKLFPSKTGNSNKGYGDEKTDNRVVLMLTTTAKTVLLPKNVDRTVVYPKYEESLVRFDLPRSVDTVPPITERHFASNATKNEGKENFAGGCLSGFKYTEDGRCMEVY